MTLRILMFFACVAAMSALLVPNSLRATAQDQRCIAPAQWFNPANQKLIEPTELLSQGAKSPVVLLGEQHENPDHHRWQLHTIASLHALNSNMVLGFEMFPRSAQPVLDAWVRGELSEKDFLAKTDWDTVWNFDAQMYLPIFHFARIHHLPMIALNVDRRLVSAVSAHGWEKIPANRKEGVKTPAPAHPDYVTMLKDVFAHHAHGGEHKTSDEKFQNFIAAQLTWDGAMAQKIAEVQKAGGEPLVVSIMGSGHLENKWGVPHQLKSLGIPSKVFIPWSGEHDCDPLSPDYVDAIFAIPENPTKIVQTTKPRLGIMIEKNKDNKGVQVMRVGEDTVAKQAGIRQGDIIMQAAGQTVKDPKALIAIIQRQAPGTWLPLQILRDTQQQEIIAKFPS